MCIMAVSDISKDERIQWSGEKFGRDKKLISRNSPLLLRVKGADM